MLSQGTALLKDGLIFTDATRTSPDPSNPNRDSWVGAPPPSAALAGQLAAPGGGVLEKVQSADASSGVWICLSLWRVPLSADPLSTIFVASLTFLASAK